MGSALCCLEKPSSSWDQSLYEELKHAEGRSESKFFNPELSKQVGMNKEKCG